MVNEQLRSEDIQIGRDRLFKLLQAEDLLIRRRKRGPQTTDSRHRLNKYGNLIRDLELTRPNQVYVSDSTYVETLLGFCYLALITDAYSRKIVGYDLSRSLSVEGSLRALLMALAQLSGPISAYSSFGSRPAVLQPCVRRFVAGAWRSNQHDGGTACL